MYKLHGVHVKIVRVAIYISCNMFLFFFHFQFTLVTQASMLMSQVKHWSVKSAQKVPTALAEVCALTTGINYPLGLRAASQMSIIQDMGMTVNILQKQMEPTVQSKFIVIK